jgi:hypothetical protein
VHSCIRAFAALCAVASDALHCTAVHQAALHKNAVFGLLEGGACDITFDDSDGLAALTVDAAQQKVARAMNATSVQL